MIRTNIPFGVRRQKPLPESDGVKDRPTFEAGACRRDVRFRGGGLDRSIAGGSSGIFDLSANDLVRVRFYDGSRSPSRLR